MADIGEVNHGSFTMKWEHVEVEAHSQRNMGVQSGYDGCGKCFIAAFARQYREDLDFRRAVNKAINFSREDKDLPLEHFQQDH